MKKFIDRNAELDQLHALYRQEKSALVILYGRRRLGKTTLLKAFSEKYNLPCCYFMADRAGEESQKNAVAVAMSAALGEPLLQTVSYGSCF